MDTTLKAAREYLFNDRAWASSGRTLDKRVNTCLTRALSDIAGEVPDALVPENYHVRVRRGYLGSASDVQATLLKTDDYKVLKVVIDPSSSWVPKTDGTWDGQMHLDITDPDGRIRRRQSREWWYDSDDEAFYVSIDRPWYDTGVSTLEFRVHQPEFFLPSDVTKVLTPLRLFDGSEQQVGQLSSGTARREGLPEYQQRTSGPPSDFWRGRMFQLDGPSLPPTVTSIHRKMDPKEGAYNNYLPWLGPVQEGRFEVCYTYAWGRVEQEWGESTGAFADAVWESAPSPVSEPFDHLVENDVHPDGSVRGRAMVIQCSNLEEMLDFMGDPNGVQADVTPYPPSTAPLRYGRSGVKIRVYIRRLATYPTHGPVVTDSALSPSIIQVSHRMNRTEADGKFYLLGEIDPLALDKTLADSAYMATPVTQVCSLTWQGDPINTTTGQYNLPPDMSRELVKAVGYYAYHLWPSPDKDYDLDISLLRQPRELTNDNDTFPIKKEAFEALMELALAYMCRLDGVDSAGEVKHRNLYRAAVQRFRGIDGDNNGVVENRPWGGGRPRTLYGLFQEG